MAKYDSNLDVLAGQLRRNATTALDKIGVEVTQNIISEAPKRKGYLKLSQFHKRKGLTLVFRNDIEYAGYVEFGTYKMNADPFFRRGLVTSFDIMNQILFDELKFE